MGGSSGRTDGEETGMDIDKFDRIYKRALSQKDKCPGAYMGTNGVDVMPCEHHKTVAHEVGYKDPDAVWLCSELVAALNRIHFLEDRQTELQELGTKHINIIRELKQELVWLYGSVEGD